MKPNVLIASGAYVDTELQAEFGRLPPAFLPLGHKRLYAHQIAMIKAQAANVFLSLPETFRPDDSDLCILDEFGVKIVYVPENISLGQSIIYSINVTASAFGGLAILHGDTLFSSLNLGNEDCVSIDTDHPAVYLWGDARHDDATGQVTITRSAGLKPNCILTGYFYFTDAMKLVQEITRQGGDFIAGLGAYCGDKHVFGIQATRWYDFGHVGTYYRSKRVVTTERAFNRLETTNRFVRKSGSNPLKIEAEARWFEQIPLQLRVFTPAYLGRHAEGNSFAYDIEYLHLPTLAELFVFGSLGQDAWSRIFESCAEAFNQFANYRPAPTTEPVAHDLYVEKTLARLELFSQQQGIDLNAPCRFEGAWLPSLKQIVTLAAQTIPPASDLDFSVIHGDFCFSNALYDGRANLIRLIDPRGLDREERFSIYGDNRYDIGKLYHSAIGLYDQIIAGRFCLTRHSDLHFSLELPVSEAITAAGSAFLQQVFAGRTPIQAGASGIAVLLFLSMLPLHADNTDRQLALLANGLRLFSILDKS